MDAEKINILLVDDDPGDCRLVKLALAKSRQAMEFAVETAGSLAEALKRLDSHNFDMVLLDLALPDSQGLETVDEVCRACPQIAVVVLTGLADENMGVRAIKMGASDYLVKGEYSHGLLLRTIRYSLERKRVEEDLRNLAKFPSENPNPVMRISRDGQILYANDASRSLVEALAVREEKQLPESWWEPLKETFNSGKACTFDFECDSRALSITLAHVPGTDYANAYALDITERKKAAEELKKSVGDLQRFNSLAVGRELRMIELKKEVNEMARKAGVGPPYDLTFVVADEECHDHV